MDIENVTQIKCYSNNQWYELCLMSNITSNDPTCELSLYTFHESVLVLSFPYFVLLCPGGDEMSYLEDVCGRWMDESIHQCASVCVCVRRREGGRE